MHPSRRPSENESKDDSSISTSNEINDSIASKSSGRKRKQFAPRKLASNSVNTTPDDEIVDESIPTASEDNLPSTESSEQKEDEEGNNVLILPNGVNEREDEQS